MFRKGVDDFMALGVGNSQFRVGTVPGPGDPSRISETKGGRCSRSSRCSRSLAFLRARREVSSRLTAPKQVCGYRLVGTSFGNEQPGRRVQSGAPTPPSSVKATKASLTTATSMSKYSAMPLANLRHRHRLEVPSADRQPPRRHSRKPKRSTPRRPRATRVMHAPSAVNSPWSATAPAKNATAAEQPADVVKISDCCIECYTGNSSRQ